MSERSFRKVGRLEPGISNACEISRLPAPFFTSRRNFIISDRLGNEATGVLLFKGREIFWIFHVQNHLVLREAFFLVEAFFLRLRFGLAFRLVMSCSASSSVRASGEVLLGKLALVVLCLT